mgnify:CR=1 FL=1
MANLTDQVNALCKALQGTGLEIIPVDKKKKPLAKQWQSRHFTPNEIMEFNPESLGIRMGANGFETVDIESILTEWKPTSEYIIELSKEIDDVAIAKYSMRDNHSNQWEDIFLGFIFKRLFGYFPNSILIQLKEVIF